MLLPVTNRIISKVGTVLVHVSTKQQQPLVHNKHGCVTPTQFSAIFSPLMGHSQHYTPSNSLWKNLDGVFTRQLQGAEQAHAIYTTHHGHDMLDAAQQPQQHPFQSCDGLHTGLFASVLTTPPTGGSCNTKSGIMKAISQPPISQPKPDPYQHTKAPMSHRSHSRQ